MLGKLSMGSLFRLIFPCISRYLSTQSITTSSKSPVEDSQFTKSVTWYIKSRIIWKRHHFRLTGQHVKTAFMSYMLQWLEQFNKELIQILEEEYQILLKETEKRSGNPESDQNIYINTCSPTKLTNIITSGEYGEHAFVIKNIEKLAKVYECEHSHSRFTHTSHLQEGRLKMSKL